MANASIGFAVEKPHFSTVSARQDPGKSAFVPTIANHVSSINNSAIAPSWLTDN
jgi:oxalate decarboxylase/phosphoglucose isomerase-like protein (cupin superfamily)